MRYKTGNGDGKPIIFRLSLESGRDGLITFFVRYPDEGGVSELLHKYINIVAIFDAADSSPWHYRYGLLEGGDAGGGDPIHSNSFLSLFEIAFKLNISLDVTRDTATPALS